MSQDELRAADERAAAAKAAYADFLARLRSADLAFAEASVLQVLVWAAPFWDHRQEASLPYGFDEGNYSHWLVALHLRRRIAPEPPLRG